MIKPRYFLRTEDDALIIVQDEPSKPPQVVPPQIARPVVVIDPANQGQVQDLVAALINASSDPGVKAYLADANFAEIGAGLQLLLPAIDQPITEDQLPPDSPFRT